MNRVVRHAIDEGCDPVTAMQMATVNTAEHFGLERELGSITPGRRADLLLIDDLKAFNIDLVLGRGEVLADKTGLTTEIPTYSYPDSAKNSVRLKRSITPKDFDIAAKNASRVTARVIGVIENQAPTRAMTAELVVNDGIVGMDMKNDICQIALVERHHNTGGVVNGFVSGFGYNKPCAMASTVAHDSHHMIVVGTDKSDMAFAANRLAEVGGGVCFYSGGVEKALVELPIAGLMSDERGEIVAAKADRLIAAMADAGCTLNNAYMQHSLLALVVIPELRISDLGLVDVTRFEKVSLLV